MRRPQGDQYDFFSIDYTFDDGVHMHSTIRQIGGCANLRDETLVGTKGSASLDQGAIFDPAGKVLWKFKGEVNDALIQEHADFVSSIRSGNPINTVKDTATRHADRDHGARVGVYGQGRHVGRDDGVGPAPGSDDLRARSAEHACRRNRSPVRTANRIRSNCHIRPNRWGRHRARQMGTVPLRPNGGQAPRSGLRGAVGSRRRSSRRSR